VTTLSSKVETVSLKDITTDPRVQRPLDEYRVRALEKDFNLEGVGILCLSKRKVGYVCLDGQHRIAALRKLGYDDIQLSAEVFSGLNLAQEAGIFIQRNNTVRVKYHDKFLVRLVEGDTLAQEMLTMINSRGWRIVGQDDMSSPTFVSVQMLEKLVKRSPELAGRVLDIVRAVWGIRGTDHRIMNGVAAFLTRYGSKIDDVRLISKMSTGWKDPKTLIESAQALRTAYKGSIHYSIADLLVVEYNKNKKDENKLPAWRS
jgi:hypothetical protein